MPRFSFIKPEKIALGIILACLGLFIFIWIAGIIGERSRKEELIKMYQLPDDLNISQIEMAVRNMLGDPEFQFYLKQLSGDDITQATNDVYNDIKNNPGKEKLLKKIEDRTALVKSLGARFQSLEIPHDFSLHPENYSDIGHMMREFLLEEFKLTVLGVLYRFKYDMGFQFRWDEASMHSATKVRKALREIDPNKRILH